MAIKNLKVLHLMRSLNCIIAVGITQRVSIVVDDGYDASRYPFIKIGL